jgi:hypothetical protein
LVVRLYVPYIFVWFGSKLYYIIIGKMPFKAL